MCTVFPVLSSWIHVCIYVSHECSSFRCYAIQERIERSFGEVFQASWDVCRNKMAKPWNPRVPPKHELAGVLLFQCRGQNRCFGFASPKAWLIYVEQIRDITRARWELLLAISLTGHESMMINSKICSAVFIGNASGSVM